MTPGESAAQVLSVDHGLRTRPEPAPGRTLCAHLARWFDHYTGAGPRHDESAAVDCAVEVTAFAREWPTRAEPVV
ncbi:hypothetical protein ABZ990_22250 [Streptomyces sp. NPDC046203]|uniref:hypothetical protein n=1 Tax=Streptomyces sp. NPDC046203 TaxID=3154602 RepID=UPI003402C655